MTEEDMDLRYCENPDLNKIFRDIKFLRIKLTYLKSKIDESHQKFAKYIGDMVRKDISERARKIPAITKDNSTEIKLTTTFFGAEGENELFYYLDTFFIDLKRCVEFTLRFLAKAEGIDLDDFSLENLLKHVKDDCKENRSKFENLLREKYPDYVKDLLSYEKWLNSLNYLRTQSIHYQIFNKTDGFKVDAEWNSIQKMEDEPTITLPTLTMFNKPIPEFTSEDLKKLDLFVNKTLSVKKGIIKYKVVI